MSGALRKMGVYLGLVEDGERYNARYDDEYDDGYEEYEDEAVDGESHESNAPEPAPVRDEQVGTVSKFPDRRGVSPSPEVTELARITTVHPRSYNEARVIGEHFRDGTPVIMNLTEMDHADAK
ncbi:MAG TPA: cell division protein SepF, partial [Kribbella sp.]